ARSVAPDRAAALARRADRGARALHHQPAPVGGLRGPWRRAEELRHVRLRAQRRRMIRRLALVATLGLLLTGCATAAPRGATPAAATGLPRPTREVLPNGVVLIVQEHRASAVVALQLWMRVGGRDEGPGEVGLSHYLEHMLFKGTPT